MLAKGQQMVGAGALHCFVRAHQRHRVAQDAGAGGDFGEGADDRFDGG